MAEQVPTKNNQPKRRIVLTDFLALALAILLTPMLVLRNSSPELLQMASDISIYPASTFTKTKAPINTAIVNQQIQGRDYLIPHVLFPGYSPQKQQSIIDAVAFIGLQKEMLYSQRQSGLRYRCPYVDHEPLMTIAQRTDSSEGNSAWKDTAYYFTGYTNASGVIKALEQDGNNNNVAGITDRNEIFLLNVNLTLIGADRTFSSFADEITQNYSVLSFSNHKIYHDHGKGIVFYTVGRTEDDNTTHLMFSYHSQLDASLIWKKHIAINNSKWERAADDPIQTPIKLTSDEDEASPYSALREAIAALPDKKHGETQMLYGSKNYIVVFTKYLIIILNKVTGNEVCTFAIRSGIRFGINGGDLVIMYLSEIDAALNQYHIVSQSIAGDTLAQLTTKLNFITKISDESTVREQALQTDMAKVKPDSAAMVESYYSLQSLKSIAIFLTPGGRVVALDQLSGTKIWSLKLPRFQQTKQNTHVSIQQTEQIPLAVVTADKNIWFINGETGELMGHWENPDHLETFDTTNPFYDDNEALVQAQVMVKELHPYTHKKAVFVVKGRELDVLSISAAGVALVDFWERFMLVGLVAFLLGIIMRQVFTVVVKAE